MAQQYTQWMSLPISVVGTTLDPLWAQNDNTSQGIVDGHDHSDGNGKPVTPAGLNINSALTFNSNPATNLLSTAFVEMSNSPVPSDALGFGTDHNFYVRDGNGVLIQMTAGGSIISSVANSYAAPPLIWNNLDTLSLFQATSQGTYLYGTLDAGRVALFDPARANGSNPYATYLIGHPYTDYSASRFIQFPAVDPSASGSFVLRTLAGGKGVESYVGPLGIAGGPSGYITLATITGDTAGNGTGNLAANTITANNIKANTITVGNIADKAAAGPTASSKLIETSSTADCVGVIDWTMMPQAVSTVTAHPPTPANIQSIPVNTDWTSTGAQFWRDNSGIVHMHGLATCSNASGATAIVNASQIPTGYKPAVTQWFVCPYNVASGPTTGVCVVSVAGVTGAITILSLIPATSDVIFFTGINYLAAA